MELLDRLARCAKDRPEQIAFKNLYTGETLNYRELDALSDRIAYRLCSLLPERGTPVVVYGHKSPLMIAAFLGCVKAGHPYCPTDISMPAQRLRDILELSQAPLLIRLEETEAACARTLDAREIAALPAPPEGTRFTPVEGEEVFYIIFTSGSTGKPKGVQITADCLAHYLRWMETMAVRGGFSERPVFLNQAPFSFDLSVMDLYTALFLGGTVAALDKRVLEDMRLLYDALGDSGIQAWVSTPSFVNMCLVSPNFDQRLLPALRSFLFCGEVLTNKTARELLRRFPEAQVVNTYGPTESTVAVTEIVVTEEMAARDTPLSIGQAKPGTQIFIMDESYRYPGLPDGEKGEIVIAGDTVARGYLHQPALTAEKFIVIDTPAGPLRAYKTGDVGWLRDGLLYYSGRMDFQLKINGYRIELGDIESNLLSLAHITACVVLPIEKNGANKGLCAFLSTDEAVADPFARAQQLRKELMDRLPQYMVPKKYIFLDSIPRTGNGKADRNALRALM